MGLKGQECFEEQRFSLVSLMDVQYMMFSHLLRPVHGNFHICGPTEKLTLGKQPTGRPGNSKTPKNIQQKMEKLVQPTLVGEPFGGRPVPDSKR